MNNLNLYWNPKIPIIVKMIDVLYTLPDCSCGGCCHIVVDDDNIRDEDLKFIIEYCKDKKNADRVDKELSSLICELLLQLNIDQRIIIFEAMGNGYDIEDKSMWDYLTKDTDLYLKYLQEFKEDHKLIGD